MGWDGMTWDGMGSNYSKRWQERASDNCSCHHARRQAHAHLKGADILSSSHTYLGASLTVPVLSFRSPSGFLFITHTNILSSLS